LKRLVTNDAMPECWAAVSPNFFTASFEPLQLGTVKFQMKGTRQLLLMHFAELQEYLKTVFVLFLFLCLFLFVKCIDVYHEVNKPFGLTDTVKFLQDISPEHIQHISSTGGMVYHGVVTSQQVCYIPAGMIVVSRTVGAAHEQNKTNIRETRVGQTRHKQT